MFYDNTAKLLFVTDYYSYESNINKYTLPEYEPKKSLEKINKAPFTSKNS
jgi:hypothetical protein